jgi:hypothetical protein
MVVAKHLRSLGYVKARVRIGHNLHWVFFPPHPQTESATTRP